jgi:ribosome-binding ATPase YchF (GTP1/OBG family)
VVRNFTDNNITHVHNRVDPAEDASIINTELALADIQTVYKRLENVKKSAKGLAAKDAEAEIACLEKVFNHLQNNQPVRNMEFTDDEKIFLKDDVLTIYLTSAPLKEELTYGKEKIKKFRRELMQLLESGPAKDRVYQLSISLFPVSKKMEAK